VPSKPLALNFDISGRPSEEDVPVLAHQRHDGTWEIVPAQVDAVGHLAISRTDFSVNIPGWLNPLAWWRGFRAKMASAVGGRTSPLTCSGGRPGWFHLEPGHSDLIHTCVKTNQANGHEVAEVQIKSNRGVTIEVTVPGNPEYVWVKGMPWTLRKWVASQLGYDPNRTVLLPPGATMTVGYKRWGTKAPGSFFISGATGYAVLDTTARGAVGFGLDTLPGAYGLAYIEVKCASGFTAGPAGLTFGVAQMHEFLTCWTGRLAEELKDPTNAMNIAQRISDPEDRDQAVAQLKAAAKAGGVLAWLVTWWPVFQAGIGNDIDKIHELATDGASAQVTWHMDPTPAPQPPKPSTGGGTQSGSGDSDRGGDTGPVTSAVPQPPKPPQPTTVLETTGGETHTWTNYTNAGGVEGPTIPGQTTVQISCRLQGFKVANGNPWWYRIAQPGWDNRFYASADAFYNNGATSGSLRGTPWVDEAVPTC